MKRDKEGHHIMIKGTIQEEDITIINIYAPNIGAPFILVSICLTYCSAPILGAYIFIVVISSSWVDHLINM